ncbi:MAG TPA: LLM class flavin-dependent oxidoreductase [Steroidobacteraceae bacterium]|jgi:alkanesulfonate monooxygenase SsuD/methylene tetrahydromethanopterin reductase-like flavin-dependent oxidoreductase (luciferase family)|nr:LLM class flavin-dependent oxidoreductase [Steroidobacteraceae bacterium]
MAQWLDDLQFYTMHFMPYVHLPPDHKKYDSLWVDFSNRFFDPQKGHELYQRYMSEMVLADQLGYDAVVVNEHHNTVYSMMPVCTVMAAALIPQTRRAKICCFGVPVNLEMPNRLAEAYAMLDVMSGGRLEIALPLGTGMEYWANSINPATARARFRESLEVLLQAWTQDGPTTFDGEFFNYRYLNPWPRPMQRPHPKIAIVGSGSPETVQIAAERGFGYSSVFVPIAAQEKTFRRLREEMPKYGHNFTPDKAMFNAIVYVAENEQLAEQEFKEHLRFWIEDTARTTPRFLNPPGYISPDQLRTRASATASHGGFDWDVLTSQWRIVFGTAEKIANTLGQWCESADSSRVILHHHIGDMPHWKVVKNMTLFAEEVIPRLRGRRASSQSHPQSEVRAAGAGAGVDAAAGGR